MPKDFVSLWDVEQAQKAKEYKRPSLELRMKRVGRDYAIPEKFIGNGWKNKWNIPADEVLRLGGYRRNGNFGWTKNWDVLNSPYRFHAYIWPDNEIHIHTDKVRDPGQKHIASVFGVGAEIKRLKGLIKPSPPAPKPKIVEVLPRAEYLVALDRLKKENEADF